MLRGICLLGIMLANLVLPSLVYADVVAKHAMVVSSQHLATRVGLDILQEGGNAVDAAVAMGYALAVVHPCCGNVGGGGFMLIRLRDGHTTAVNFRERAPASLNVKQLIQEQQQQPEAPSAHITGDINKPYLQAGIPGTVLGLNTVLQKFGTMPLSKLMQPAIAFAESGFVLNRQDVDILNAGYQSFLQQPNVATIFTNHGKPYQVGDRLQQQELAKTLLKISRTGSDGFYQGDTAKQLIAAVNEHGATWTINDLLQYQVSMTQAISCDYHGYKIYSIPPPGSGITLCQILNIAAEYPLAKWGFRSPTSLNVNLEAMRYAFADRNTYLGDPNFVDIPANKLLSVSYAKSIKSKIKLWRAGDSKKLGFIAKSNEGQHTTSYVVVDRYGNAVAVTYTLNSYFGGRVIPGKLGFFLNNELDDFAIDIGRPNMFGLIQGRANLIAPSKQPLSSIAPVIITKDGKLYMVLATPGGSTIPTSLVEVIENVVDYNMSLQAAVNAPRYHFQWLPDKVFMEPGAISAKTQKYLQRMGYTLQDGSPFNTDSWGAVTAILVNPKTDELTGMMDKRRPGGLAIGY